MKSYLCVLYCIVWPLQIDVLSSPCLLTTFTYRLQVCNEYISKSTKQQWYNIVMED